MLKNRLLRRTFGHKKGEAIGSWIKLHNMKLHKLYFSPNVIRMIKSKIRETSSAFKILVVRADGNRLLGKPRRRWEDNIKTNLKGIGCENVD
jgi:hypothetical protein